MDEEIIEKLQNLIFLLLKEINNNSEDEKPKLQILEESINELFCLLKVLVVESKELEDVAFTASSEMLRLQLELQDKATEVQRLQLELQDKATEVQRLQLELQDKATEVQRLQLELQDKATEVQQLQLELQDKTTEVVQLLQLQELIQDDSGNNAAPAASTPPQSTAGASDHQEIMFMMFKQLRKDLKISRARNDEADREICLLKNQLEMQVVHNRELQADDKTKHKTEDELKGAREHRQLITLVEEVKREVEEEEAPRSRTFRLRDEDSKSLRFNVFSRTSQVHTMTDNKVQQRQNARPTESFVGPEWKHGDESEAVELPPAPQASTSGTSSGSSGSGELLLATARHAKKGPREVGVTKVRFSKAHESTPDFQLEDILSYPSGFSSSTHK